MKLRQERERRGWSRSYVAGQIEVDVITVGRWERGERMPHPYHRQKLCALFEMNAQDLGLVPTLPQKQNDTVIIPDLSSEESDAVTVVSQESNNAAPLPDLSSGESDAVTVVSQESNNAAPLPNLSSEESDTTTGFHHPPLQTSYTNTKAPKASSLLFLHRRKLLLAGLAGLGVIALASNGLLQASVSMPLSKRVYQIIDLNTDNHINSMAWSPDNSAIAVAYGVNVVSIRNIEKKALLQYCQTSNEWANDVSWSKDNMIAVATAEIRAAGSLQVWNHPYNNPIFTLSLSYGLCSVSWSPNGRYLAFSGRTPIVEVWDFFTRTRVSKYSTFSLPRITRVRWSASGTYLACTVDDGTLHVWEGLTGKPRTIYRGHASRVLDLAWSPDERYIASASADKTSHVWEVSSGRTACIYTGHTDQVDGVDWYPRGPYVASGGLDCTAHVWEAFTGKLIAKYEGRKSSVETVLWSADGATLAMGTHEEGVEIWQAPALT